jgi:hypothetical protein
MLANTMFTGLNWRAGLFAGTPVGYQTGAGHLTPRETSNKPR